MKSVLVTGGTTRLGCAIAARLRTAGWRVLTSSHRPEAGADILVDLAAPDGASRCLAAVRALLGGALPDALVNNAALFTGSAARLRALNFAAPVALTEGMAARTPDEPRGSVVNILDCRVLTAAPSDAVSSVYEETKRALLAETRAAARRYAGTLRVNAVSPGPVLMPTEVREKAGQTPFGRPTAEQVAEAVLFLLSAASTSGCLIPVDGGQSLV